MNLTERRAIGVFDSGIGGLSVLQALRAELPLEDFVYLDDSLHAPYGERGDDHVVARTHAIASHLRETHGIKALVIACNTATMAAVVSLRAAHPELPIVGVEPGLKPAAAQSRTGHVGVIGTRGTVTSAKFDALRRSLDGRATFVVQACDGLADAINRSVASNDDTRTKALCESYIAAMGRFGTGPGEIDTLVLGCTHYVFAREHLRQLLGAEVRILSTGEPVARHTRHLLQTARRLASTGPGRVQLETTGEPAMLEAAAQRWLAFATEAARRV